MRRSRPGKSSVARADGAAATRAPAGRNPRAKQGSYRDAVERARSALASGDAKFAEREFRLALELHDADPVALSGLGHALRLQRREREALLPLRAAAARLRPALHLAEGRAGLLDIAFEMQEALAADDALAIIRDVLDAAPDCARAWHLHARACLRTGGLEEAAESISHARSLLPTSPRVSLLAAEIAIARGHGRDARALLVPLIAQTGNADRGLALQHLAASHETCGEHARAFAVMAMAGRAIERDRTEAAAATDNLKRALDDTLARCSADFLAHAAARTVLPTAASPLFLLGYLRSGTTLLEQILAAHPQVCVSNEADLVPEVMRELERLGGRGRHWVEQVEQIGAAGIERLRAHYWALARERLGHEPGHGVLLDKCAMNTINIGLINVLFPRARVLFAMRDPRDVCISSFMQAFAPSPLTRPWLVWREGVRAYAEVMAFWREMRTRLTVEIEAIRYEALVAAPGDVLRPVFSRLGLAWTTSCEHANEHRRAQAVRTPSHAQVARPVYRHAVQRWRQHAQPCAAVDDLLATSIADFGYDA